MVKLFESSALQGASNEAEREQADFLSAVIEMHKTQVSKPVQASKNTSDSLKGATKPKST